MDICCWAVLFRGLLAGLCDELLFSTDFYRGHRDTGMGVALLSPPPPDPTEIKFARLIPCGDKIVTILIP
jgi:hypothetical protein